MSTVQPLSSLPFHFLVVRHSRREKREVPIPRPFEDPRNSSSSGSSVLDKGRGHGVTGSLSGSGSERTVSMAETRSECGSPYPLRPWSSIVSLLLYRILS